jgi:uncharacterized protein
MKFWDASALVPLLVNEAATRRMRTLAAKDPSILVWWAAEVESASALSRLERDGCLEASAAATAFKQLKRLAASWHEIEPSDVVRESAIRFLRVHPLRVADSLQLAAAFVAAEGRPATLELVTLDDRLASAARKEGFAIIGS